MDANSVWALVTSVNKLDRDRGEQELEAGLKNGVIDGEAFMNIVLSGANAAASWETKLGVLLAASILARQLNNLRDPLLQLAPRALEWLSEDEVRVRIAGGHYFGSLCHTYGPDVYQEYREPIFELVRENTNRGGSEEDQEKHASDKQILHDTAGWRNLETSVKCVEAIVKGCGDAFKDHVDLELLNLIFVTLAHPNRFVRESGYLTCGTIIEVTSKDNDVGQDCPAVTFASQFEHHLAQGLADNWSQVRMAASVAARHFLLALRGSWQSSRLLPSICLNRYYLAEGVRIYSQDTWVMVVGHSGKSVVANDIANFVSYYIACTKADNHAVREAACQCIAELAAKVSSAVMTPYIDVLIDTLHECFNDQSWPVRDYACVACGTFIQYFPQESKSKFEYLKPLFLDNLRDPISSVRQGAAQALAKTVCAFMKDDSSIIDDLVAVMREGFLGVEAQPAESHKYGDLSHEPANFGVVKRMRDNDPDLHENQTMYSCGSLAPKMQRSGCGGGHFKKPSEPWEAADGCLYLAAELAKIPGCAEKVANVLPLIEDATRRKHYTMHLYFIETVAKLLPEMAKSIGKRLFKPHLERFFDAIFYACQSDNALASAASRDCLAKLSDFLGPSIMRGRVEQFDPNLVSLYDQLGSSACTFSASHPLSINIPHQPSLGGTPTGSPR